MKNQEYGIYGTEGKHQLFCERVIYNDVPGLGYIKPDKGLISFISRKELLDALDGPYRYISETVLDK